MGLLLGFIIKMSMNSYESLDSMITLALRGEMEVKVKKINAVNGNGNSNISGRLSSQGA
jgi:hypothetical protein